ncbi:CTP synthase [Camellia lanceoleosa]|uniref:CTP synthase n=1 Tax=Camellia lanceoleosa TaxID=1840588 RepID=A0ACC0IVH9_9ERIC|nr:CTP synthase [Camellia lanceoleosa]
MDRRPRKRPRLGWDVAPQALKSFGSVVNSNSILGSQTFIPPELLKKIVTKDKEPSQQMHFSPAYFDSRIANLRQSTCVINILNLMDVAMDKTDASGTRSGVCDYLYTLCQQSFPSPLVCGNVGSREVNKWIDEKIANCKSPDMDYRKGELLRATFLFRIAFEHLPSVLQHAALVNPDIVAQLEDAGLSFTGKDESGQRMEIVGLSSHSFYVGVQFHPEFKSRLGKPLALFLGLIAAACGQLDAVLKKSGTKTTAMSNGTSAIKSHQYGNADKTPNWSLGVVYSNGNGVHY